MREQLLPIRRLTQIIFNYMLENGIYVAPSQFEAMFISAAHSDEDIQRTIDVLTK